jgi:demethylmenaquinone methyltransferase/2-methoxy-6-polyprenyl-1,4-benzoquinol methylase
METLGPRPDPEKIHSMFSAISQDYDRANTVMSMGIHHLWRQRLVRFAQAKIGGQVLDCATGTGDLAIEFKKAVGTVGTVTGTDFCAEMMAPAPAKARKLALEIRFEQADVLHLPYADQSFDIASIAFGIRNVGDPARGLRELARVVRPGGSVMILEFGQPKSSLINSLYTHYSRHILPRIGGWVTGKRDAYEYLQDSSAHFPCREEFVALMMNTGAFRSVEYKSLTGGIAYMYKGLV